MRRPGTPKKILPVAPLSCGSITTPVLKNMWHTEVSTSSISHNKERLCTYDTETGYVLAQADTER